MPATEPPKTDNYADALASVFRPLVRLMIANGVLYPAIAEQLLQLYVEVAREHFIDNEADHTASRVHLLTGINRKRLPQLMTAQPARQAPVSLSQQVMDAITHDPRLLDRRGQVKPMCLLRRDGGDLSFEAVVESVSREVRSRALLDQWIASGVGRIGEDGRLHIDLAAAPSTFLDKVDVTILQRGLRPAALAAVNGALRTSNPAGTMFMQASGLSETEARGFQKEIRQQQFALLMRMNRRGEVLARNARRRKAAGEFTVCAGVYDWLDMPPGHGIDVKPHPEKSAQENSHVPSPSPRRRTRALTRRRERP